jgi:hypothetical protein
MSELIKRLISQVQKVANPVKVHRRKSLVTVVVKQTSHANIAVNGDTVRKPVGISFLIRPLLGSVRSH